MPVQKLGRATFNLLESQTAFDLLYCVLECLILGDLLLKSLSIKFKMFKMKAACLGLINDQVQFDNDNYDDNDNSQLFLSS